jgi:hypothetical protein
VDAAAEGRQQQQQYYVFGTLQLDDASHASQHCNASLARQLGERLLNELRQQQQEDGSSSSNSNIMCLERCSLMMLAMLASTATPASRGSLGSSFSMSCGSSNSRTAAML